MAGDNSNITACAALSHDGKIYGRHTGAKRIIRRLRTSKRRDGKPWFQVVIENIEGRVEAKRDEPKLFNVHFNNAGRQPIEECSIETDFSAADGLFRSSKPVNHTSLPTSDIFFFALAMIAFMHPRYLCLQVRRK